jgi:hypothetical protein
MTKQEQVTILEESLKRLAALAADSTQLADSRLQAERQIAVVVQVLQAYGNQNA